MGSYTYGEAHVEFTRPLTEPELADYVAKLKAYPSAETENDYVWPWEVNTDADGDVGRVTVDADGFVIEVGGKVYDVAGAAAAFVEALPADVGVKPTTEVFETESEHWALRFVGREVSEVYVYRVPVGELVRITLDGGAVVVGAFVAPAWVPERSPEPVGS